MRQFIDRHFRGNSFSPKRVTPILTPFLSRVSTDRFGHQRTLKPDKSRCFHSIDGRLWTFSEGGVGAGCRIRTRDLRFTKPLHYHCAKPAKSITYVRSSRPKSALESAMPRFRSAPNLRAILSWSRHGWRACNIRMQHLAAGGK
jgi:hypothetical protein